MTTNSLLSDPLHQAASIDMVSSSELPVGTINSVELAIQSALPNKLGAECAVQTLLAVASILPTVVDIPTNNSIDSIFQEYRVPMLDSDLNVTLECLAQLLIALQQKPSMGLSPGFATRYQENWTSGCKFPYDIMGLSTIPLLSTGFVIQCCYRIQKVLLDRQAHLCGLLPNACRCLSDWEFYPGSVTEALVNFSVEKYMTEEAAAFCSERVDPIQWDTECYQKSLIPGNCISQPNNSICLLRNRDVYLETLIKLAVRARTCISIATTYIHSNDPAARYVLLDLLPYCARIHKVKVKLLVDLMTVEGKLVQSAFVSMGGSGGNTTSRRSTEIRSDSFLERLPTDAPAFALAAKDPTSPLGFYQQLFQLAATTDTYQIQFWCARDKQERFRIKNHAKCFVVDNQVAIFGGSNLCPTVTAAANELDVLVSGPTAQGVTSIFDRLWSEMTTGYYDVDMMKEIPNNRLLTQFIQETLWTDVCDVGLLQSSPSSLGEDLILNSAMAAIRQSKASVLMCFGHCNIPRPVAKLLLEATQRGVRVEIIVNSMYSNDLRTDQRDLFLSIENLLVTAPKVKVYTTALVDGERPPFLHAKYITIDGQRSLVGSWNMWTRSAFFELEMEAVVESPKIAMELQDKFEHEKTTVCTRINSISECCAFGPSGCSVCSCFGSFYS